MDVEALFPFTPFPAEVSANKTPLRHKRKRQSTTTTTPSTSTSAQQPHSKPSARSASSSHLYRPPAPDTATSLLSLLPRCPTASCAHHDGFKALCTEWAYGSQYVLTCPGCQAIIYPCDCCHQVAAHPAVTVTASASSSSCSFSACSECGFLTLINPRLRQLLRLPTLLPLSSTTTLSIQSSISLPLYQQRREFLYKSAHTAHKALDRAEQASKRREEEAEAEDGGESDTIDQPIRPAQRTAFITRKRPKAADGAQSSEMTLLETALLRRREELLAVNQLLSTQLRSPPSFSYGAQLLDSVPFTSHHLQSLHSTLLSPAIVFGFVLVLGAIIEYSICCWDVGCWDDRFERAVIFP